MLIVIRAKPQWSDGKRDDEEETNYELGWTGEHMKKCIGISACYFGAVNRIILKLLCSACKILLLDRFLLSAN